MSQPAIESRPGGAAPRRSVLDRGKRWLKLAWQDWRAASGIDRSATHLVSYPKAGATWLQFILAETFARHFGLEWDGPTVELADLTRRYPQLPRIRWTHDGGSIVNEDGRRSNPLRLFEYGGRRRYRASRVVLMARDPRDVVVSYFHQATRRSESPLPIASLSEFVRHPHLGLNRVLRFYEIWHRNRKKPRELLLVRYEDLLTRGAASLRPIMSFLGVDASQETLESAFAYAAADNMRQLETAGAVRGMRSFGTEQDSLKVRKAKSGTFREEMSADDVAFCNREMARLPAWYGYAPD